MSGAIARTRRASEVVTTLMFEGLHVPLARMRVARCASWSCRARCTWARWTGRRISEHPWPVAVRLALTRLGPAFVKLGQILSVRTDLVPEALAVELHRLQSDVPPVPFSQIRETVEASLGQPLDQAFSRFDEAPLAAGSVAQVHTAWLADGSKVAVKVKRPGIDVVVAEDLAIAVWLAEAAERHWAAAKPYRPAAAARELQRYTLAELDFRNEARVAREIGQRFASWERVRVPEVHEATRDVLVMAFVDGFPLDDVDQLDAAGIDRHEMVRLVMEAVLAQIFDFGLFHADPHPGNLHATADGELVLLDFGIFGALTERMQRDSALLMWALSRGDTELASAFLLRMAQLEPDADVPAFRRAVEARYRDWQGRSVSEYGFARLLYDELTLGARHGVIFPSDAVLLGKAMVTMEGIALAVDPELDLSREAEPYLQGVRDRLFRPERLVDAVVRSLPLWWEVAERLPLALAERSEQGAPRAPTAQPAQPSPVVPAAALLGGAALLASGLPPVVWGWSLPGALLLGLALWWARPRRG